MRPTAGAGWHIGPIPPDWSVAILMGLGMATGASIAAAVEIPGNVA